MDAQQKEPPVARAYVACCVGVLCANHPTKPTNYCNSDKLHNMHHLVLFCHSAVSNVCIISAEDCLDLILFVCGQHAYACIIEVCEGLGH